MDKQEIFDTVMFWIGMSIIPIGVFFCWLGKYLKDKTYRTESGKLIGWEELPPIGRSMQPRPCAIIECIKNNEMYHVYYVVSLSFYKSVDIGQIVDIEADWEIDKAEWLVD